MIGSCEGVATKVGGIWQGFSKEKLSTQVEQILMNLKTNDDIFYLEFHTSLDYIKEDDNDYTFDCLYGLLISVHEKVLHECKPENKQQSHLIKGKG